MEWRHFIVSLGSLDPIDVETVLLGHGAIAVTFTDGEDDPIIEPGPGETPLWPNTEVTALFRGKTDLSKLPESLMASLKLSTIPPNRVEDFQEKAWELEWLKDFSPMRFGKRLWVVPGDTPDPSGPVVVVRIDPGLAFGTGAHPTTALCLEWLDRIDLRGKRLYDFGCGSGILSIAALKLGATEALALDTDPQAALSAQQNAEKNFVGDRLCVRTNVSTMKAPCDIVVANILAGTLIDNATLVCQQLKSRGQIGLSGILSNQVDDVINAYCGYVDFTTPRILDEWALLTGLRK